MNKYIHIYLCRKLLMNMTQIIAFLNHKGGVGKTTSSVNVGAGLALKKKKVLLIDLDPQANLTLHFGLSVNTPKNIYGALRGFHSLPIENIKKNLDVVTSTLDLSAAEMELNSEAGREFILRHLLEPVKSQYDYIIIDCPPSLGILTLNALAVSNTMIIPIEMSAFALAGMTKLFEIIEKVKLRLNPNLSDYKLLMTKVDSRKTIHRNIRDVVEVDYEKNLFKTKIRTNVSLEEAQMVGKDIFEYSEKSMGAEDYEKICKELIKTKLK